MPDRAKLSDTAVSRYRPACKTDPVSGYVPVTTLDENFRRAVLAYFSRSRLNARQFGQFALGDPGFVPSLDKGQSLNLDTADQVLRFIDESPNGPMFRPEVEALLSVTGGGGVTLGFKAIGDPPRLQKTFFTSREAAEFLMLSPRTLDRYRAS